MYVKDMHASIQEHIETNRKLDENIERISHNERLNPGGRKTLLQQFYEKRSGSEAELAVLWKKMPNQTGVRQLVHWALKEFPKELASFKESQAAEDAKLASMEGGAADQAEIGRLYRMALVGAQFSMTLCRPFGAEVRTLTPSQVYDLHSKLSASFPFFPEVRGLDGDENKKIVALTREETKGKMQAHMFEYGESTFTKEKLVKELRTALVNSCTITLKLEEVDALQNYKQEVLHWQDWCIESLDEFRATRSKALTGEFQAHVEEQI